MLTVGFWMAYDLIDIDSALRSLCREQHDETGRISDTCQCRLVLREGGLMIILGWMAIVCLAASTVVIVLLLHRTFQYVYVKVSPERIDDNNSRPHDLRRRLRRAPRQYAL